MTLPVTAQAAFVATLVDEWCRAGVTDAVIAPGSRSTPLALALAGDARMRVHVHLDERSAGFMALGLGLASGRPAPVVTTSGSAPAHLLPAVIEAHHARVPMIVCSADRPPELHSVGAPQTVEQGGLYDGFLRWRSDPRAVGDLPRSMWRSLGARSVAEAVAGPDGPGPVQLNLGFRDPLVAAAGDLPPGRSGGRPWHGIERGPRAVPPGLWSVLDARAGLLVAGGGVGDREPVVALARSLGWPVLADGRSGCRGPVPTGEAAVVVSAFDAIVRAPSAASFLRPEVVVHLGAPLASKVANDWLSSSDALHVLADPHGTWTDPDRLAGTVVACEPEVLCRALLARPPAPAPDGWAARWRAAETAAQQSIESTLHHETVLTEPAVARVLTGALPSTATLFVASSMPIRDVEWFGAPWAVCRVLANRGANGIDGMVSSALGVAAGSAGPVVALLGDLAFLHDSGGLLGAARRGLDCTFVVIDNDGGGIFSFLPQAGLLAPDRFEQLFGTPHGIDLCALADVHGIASSRVASAAELEAGLPGAGVRLLVVPSDRATNVDVHGRLNAAVAAAVA